MFLVLIHPVSSAILSCSFLVVVGWKRRELTCRDPARLHLGSNSLGRRTAGFIKLNCITDVVPHAGRLKQCAPIGKKEAEEERWRGWRNTGGREVTRNIMSHRTQPLLLMGCQAWMDIMILIGRGGRQKRAYRQRQAIRSVLVSQTRVTRALRGCFLLIMFSG